MYDKEFVKLLVSSPFVSFIPTDISRRDLIEGYKYGLRAQTVPPGLLDVITKVKKEHDNGTTRTGMVIGYPYGGFSKNFKVYLAKEALRYGIDEVDVGINVTAAASGDIETVKDELLAILNAVEGKVKVVPMLWMVKLPFEIVDKLCEMYIEIGITAVKTSAGIHFGSMTLEHIEHIARNYGDKLSIEVAGRCRSRQLAEDMLKAGASYFHSGSWKKMSGIGTDIQFDYDTKITSYEEIK